MKLVTGSNESYRNHMSVISSAIEHGSFPVVYVGVGWQPPAIHGATVTSITTEQNVGAPPQTECIQHGSFLHVVQGSPEEVILYTDGDLTQQRPIDDDELALLDLRHGEVLVGWNGREGETLAEEAARLGPKTDLREWGDINNMASYNAGCMAMTRHTWKQMHRDYMAYWPRACESFSHQARQQWLISWLINLQFRPTIMPWTMHYHGHHGNKPGMSRDGVTIIVNGRVALFRHFA